MIPRLLRPRYGPESPSGGLALRNIGICHMPFFEGSFNSCRLPRLLGRKMVVFRQRESWSLTLHASLMRKYRTLHMIKVD